MLPADGWEHEPNQTEHHDAGSRSGELRKIGSTLQSHGFKAVAKHKKRSLEWKLLLIREHHEFAQVHAPVNGFAEMGTLKIA